MLRTLLLLLTLATAPVPSAKGNWNADLRGICGYVLMPRVGMLAERGDCKTASEANHFLLAVIGIGHCHCPAL